MCNRFIKECADKICGSICKCDCFALKNSCKNVDFQFTNKNIRKIFVHAEIYDLHGYGGKIFSSLQFTKVLVDMAICYLHEKDVENFFTLISSVIEYNFWKTKIDAETKSLLKSKIKNHLPCIPTNLFDHYYVHVGFGEWNERDELIKDRPNYRTDTRGGISHQEYMVVNLNLWLHIFIEKDKPRTFLYNLLNSDQDLSTFLDAKYLKFENMEKVNEKKFTGNFTEKLANNIIENLKCKCVYLNYTPKNVRDLFKTFNYSDPEIIYKKTGIYNEERDKYDKIEYYDFALDYLYEKNYVDFFNIVSQLGINDKIRNEIFKISYTDIKDYRVNINMKYDSLKIYKKDQIFDNKIGKLIEYADYQSNNDNITDHNRYNIPYSKKFLNIGYDRWLSDIILHDDPFKKWKVLLQNGLKYKLNIFS